MEVKNNFIPLCVPYWEEREALNEGASYSKEHGFYAPETVDPDALWPWLPLRWKYPGQPTLWPEMLPSSSWEDNLRNALSPAKWDALRRHSYALAGNRCQICGDRARLECHERWSFDDTWCVQKLDGLIALCPTCHKAHHLGIARRLGLYERVLAKMQEVNSWTRKQVEQAISQAKRQADERNRFFWTVDTSWIESSAYSLIYQLDGNY